VEEDVVAEDEMEDDDVKDDEVEEEEDNDGENGGVEAKNRFQDLGPHFVRACAVPTHVRKPQEPVYTENNWKHTKAQIHGAVRAGAVDTHVKI
jgi:hypothetical protein